MAYFLRPLDKHYSPRIHHQFVAGANALSLVHTGDNSRRSFRE